jgi:hypothetical protein
VHQAKGIYKVFPGLILVFMCDSWCKVHPISQKKKKRKHVRSSGQAGFQSSGEKLSSVHPWNSFEPFNIVMPYVGFPNSKSSP